MSFIESIKTYKKQLDGIQLNRRFEAIAKAYLTLMGATKVKEIPESCIDFSKLKSILQSSTNIFLTEDALKQFIIAPTVDSSLSRLTDRIFLRDLDANINEMVANKVLCNEDGYSLLFNRDYCEKYPIVLALLILEYYLNKDYTSSYDAEHFTFNLTYHNLCRISIPKKSAETFLDEINDINCELGKETFKKTARYLRKQIYVECKKDTINVVKTF